MYVDIFGNPVPEGSAIIVFGAALLIDNEIKVVKGYIVKTEPIGDDWISKWRRLNPDKATYCICRHRESGRGFVLNRLYHIIKDDVLLDVPDNPVEIELNHIPGSSFPEWVVGTKGEFDTYWLY